MDRLREAREMTQVHLAKILGVNQAAVSKLERRAGYVREHAAEFCEGNGRRVEDYGAVPGGHGGD
jgi:predicted transcriptional regulator